MVRRPRSVRARRACRTAGYLAQPRYRRHDGTAGGDRYYDAVAGRYTLYAGSGGIVRQKKEISAILGVPFESVRVIAREIGGNFGTRNSFFPEFALVVWGSRRVGRPVKWTADRTEAFISDYMGRDLTVSAELALDADGHFLALRTSNSAISARTPVLTCRWSKASDW